MKRIIGLSSLAFVLALAFSPAAFAQVPYDIAVRKTHSPAGVYVIDTTNLGPAIPGQGRIDVIDLLPQGITVTSISAPGWTCTPAVPVVGPDAITCTRLFNNLAAGAVLPSITMKITGVAQCPNCVRAKLYRRNTAGTYILFPESNLGNNVSCVP